MGSFVPDTLENQRVHNIWRPRQDTKQAWHRNYGSLKPALSLTEFGMDLKAIGCENTWRRGSDRARSLKSAVLDGKRVRSAQSLTKSSRRLTSPSPAVNMREQSEIFRKDAGQGVEDFA